MWLGKYVGSTAISPSTSVNTLTSGCFWQFRATNVLYTMSIETCQRILHQPHGGKSLLFPITLTLKVGIKLSRITFVAPNDVIWKQLLYCWIWVKKWIESGPFPETNECSGSGGGTNGVNLTWPLAQHNPGASFLNFNALQCGHTTFIGPIATICCEL